MAIGGLRSTAKTSGAVPVGTSTTTVLPANVGRREVTITNDGANVVYLMLNTTDGATMPTAVAGQGLRLNASGGSWSSANYRGPIAGIALTGATNCTVAEIQGVVPVTNPPDLTQMAVAVMPPVPVDPSAAPTMAISAPPGQTITSQIPTGGTKVQKAVVTTNAAGVATWTFPAAFQNPPVIAAICEGSGSQVVVSAQVTAISATSVTVQVSKSTATVNGLLGLTILVAVGSPGATNVHLYAAPNPN